MIYKKRRRQSQPVRCVETGQVFRQIKDAAAWLGKSPTAISLAVRGLNPSAGGYHWEYVVEDEDEEAALFEQEAKPGNLRRPPRNTIYEVQEEAMRRTKETGRLVRYAHIQKEETVQMIRERDRLEKEKRSVDDG